MVQIIEPDQVPFPGRFAIAIWQKKCFLLEILCRKKVAMTNDNAMETLNNTIHY